MIEDLKHLSLATVVQSPTNKFSFCNFDAALIANRFIPKEDLIKVLKIMKHTQQGSLKVVHIPIQTKVP